MSCISSSFPSNMKAGQTLRGSSPLEAQAGSDAATSETVARRPAEGTFCGSDQYGRLQKVREADTVQHLRANTVEHGESDIGTVFSRVDMHAEGALAER